jgi:hypothetical protein
MSNFQIFKVTTLPVTPVPNGVYLIPSSEPDYFEIYVADSLGSSLKKTPSITDFEIMLLQAAIFRVTVKPITTNYTLTLLDGNGKTLIEASSATDMTVTVPSNASVAFDIGTSLMFVQADVGKVIFAPAAGVTILTPETLTTRKQHGHVSLIKVATNTWRLEGNLEAL